MGNSLKKMNHTLGGLLPNSNTIFGQHLIVGDAAGDVVLFAGPWRGWEGVSEKHVWVAALGVVEMCHCQMNIIHTSRETLEFLDNSRSWVVPGSSVLSDECDPKVMGTLVCTYVPWNVCWGGNFGRFTCKVSET